MGKVKDFFKRNKKKLVVGPLVGAMLASGVALKQDVDGSYNLRQSEVAAQQSGYQIPGAILADRDNAVNSAWNVLKSGYGDDHYQLNTRETVLTMLRIHNRDTTRTKVDFLTPQTSHAYYLVAGKLHYVPIGKIPESNHSLIQFATGIQQFFKSGWSNDKPDYHAASKNFAQGMFLAAMPGQNKEALALASQFMGSDVRGKELILRDVYEKKFKNVKANPKTTDVNSMEYKMLSFYWNLGLCLISHRGINQNDTYVALTRDQTYNNLNKKFNFHTASVSLIN